MVEIAEVLIRAHQRAKALLPLFSSPSILVLENGEGVGVQRNFRVRLCAGTYKTGVCGGRMVV